METTNFANECWLPFWRGATRPALPALLIALAVIVMAFVTFGVLITPKVIAGPGYVYFMINELDTHANVTHKALSFEPAKSPVVVILGTSITHRCIASEESLAAMIGAQWGTTPEVYDMTMDGQTPWEMAALVERLGPRFNGVLVIGLTPGLLSFGIDDERYSSLARILKQPKLGFVSAALDEEARIAGLKVPLRTGIYSLDNTHFYLLRRHRAIINLILGGKVYGDPVTASSIEKVDFARLWRRDMDNLPEQVKHYDLNAKNNLAVLDRLASKSLSSGKVSAMVLEGPIHPKWRDDPAVAPSYKRYQMDLAQFAARHGLPHVSITDKASLREPDFFDYEGHMGTVEGRERCTKALAASIAEELVQRGKR